MTSRLPAYIAVAAAVAALAGNASPICAQEAGADAAPIEAATREYFDGLRQARNQLVSVQDHAGALEPARILAQEAGTSTDSDSLADRIMYAVVLAELDRFDDAELELLNVIESVESSDGVNAERLIAPLRMLGRAYIRMRMFPEAVTALTEARAVSRRTAGLFNVEHQITVIDDLTDAQLGLGDTEAAHELQLERLEVAQRQFGDDDPQVIPYHYHLASYYEDSRMRQSARAQYENALAIAEAQGDTEEMLNALANVVRQDLQSAQSDSSTVRLAEFVGSLPAQHVTQGLAFANAVLGDAALIDEDADAAADYYARSWALFAATGEIDPAVYFSDPAIIRFIAPLTSADFGTMRLPIGWGEIALEFDVDADGRVSNIGEVRSEPGPFMDDAYVERLEDAWFRPALVEGKPVDAAGVVFTHYFRFYYDPDKQED